MTEVHTSVKDIEILKYNKGKICDAAGCHALGTNEIKLTAGKFGILTLFVCTGCLGKFKDD